MAASMLSARLSYVARATSKVARFSAAPRSASTLVLADHDGSNLLPDTFNTITAASKIGGDITVLVTSDNPAVAEAAAKVAGVSKVVFAKGAQFKGLVAESVCNAILAAQESFGFSHIFAPANAVGKNVLPRVAAKLDVAAISDIIGVDSEDTFVRTMYAGNAVQTLRSSDGVKVVTARSTAFDAAAADGGSASIEDISGM
eukprot:m.23557 g.23557  ORF g.23557 m.23557 type:complete len:201 (+) comp7224_c0_seq1:236-838(+)